MTIPRSTIIVYIYIWGHVCECIYTLQLYFLQKIYQNIINMDDENDNGVNLQK